MFTYTNDERFTVLHAEGSDDWTLQIKYVQKRDNGTYECQVSEKRLVDSRISIHFHIVLKMRPITRSKVSLLDTKKCRKHFNKQNKYHNYMTFVCIKGVFLRVIIKIKLVNK